MKEHRRLSKRDTLLLLELLEHPPPLPISKVVAATKTWTENQKMLDAFDFSTYDKRKNPLSS